MFGILCGILAKKNDEKIFSFSMFRICREIKIIFDCELTFKKKTHTLAIFGILRGILAKKKDEKNFSFSKFRICREIKKIFDCELKKKHTCDF